MTCFSNNWENSDVWDHSLLQVSVGSGHAFLSICICLIIHGPYKRLFCSTFFNFLFRTYYFRLPASRQSYAQSTLHNELAGLTSVGYPWLVSVFLCMRCLKLFSVDMDLSGVRDLSHWRANGQKARVTVGLSVKPCPPFSTHPPDHSTSFLFASKQMFGLLGRR